MSKLGDKRERGYQRRGHLEKKLLICLVFGSLYEEKEKLYRSNDHLLVELKPRKVLKMPYLQITVHAVWTRFSS